MLFTNASNPLDMNVLISEEDYLLTQIQACSDAIIHLTPTPRDYTKGYEIRVGIEENTKTQIIKIGGQALWVVAWFRVDFRERGPFNWYTKGYEIRVGIEENMKTQIIKIGGQALWVGEQEILLGFIIDAIVGYLVIYNKYMVDILVVVLLAFIAIDSLFYVHSTLLQIPCLWPLRVRMSTGWHIFCHLSDLLA